MKRDNRKQKGQGLIEVVTVCSAVMIPVALMFLDAIALVGAQSVNVALTKSAARAAANGSDLATAQAAANKVQADFHTSSMIPHVQLRTGFNATYGINGQVLVDTRMTVVLPVPVPGLPSELTLHARSTEAVTGKAPVKLS